MTLSLLYKEWIKLRLWWALMLVASTAFALFLFLKLRHVFAVNDPPAIWNFWMIKHWLCFRAWQHTPPVLGVVLGLLQFLPEVQARRVRLVLHLPLGENRSVGLHLAAGLGLLALALLPAMLLFIIGGACYFPDEWRHNLLTVLAPALLAGCGAYFAIAAILLETNWRHRVFLLLLALGGLRLYTMENALDTYQRVLAPLALWALALVLVPLYSSHRFRKGLR